MAEGSSDRHDSAVFTVAVDCGRVLWPDAELDAGGNPVAWPGWDVDEDGNRSSPRQAVHGARDEVDMTVEVNPTFGPVTGGDLKTRGNRGDSLERLDGGEPPGFTGLVITMPHSPDVPSTRGRFGLPGIIIP